MNMIRKLYRGWIQFGNILGEIVSILLLTIVYFSIVGILTLIAFIFRVDFLRLKKTEGSYWLDPQKEHMDLKYPF